MLGFFNKRKRYNGEVDTKLNTEYQIKTRDNPLFPGALKYLSIIDNAWNAKMNSSEGALYIATLYYCGIVKHGHTKEGAALLERINHIVGFNLKNGIVTESLWYRFANEIDQATEEVESKL